MSFPQPNPTTWTIRLKRNKVTVVLHADPLEPIEKLQENLLDALRLSEKDHKLDGTPLPEKPQDILLGKPIDPRDLSKGWVGISDEATGSTKKPAGQDPHAKIDSLKGCGIKEDAILAFRFNGKTTKSDEPLESNGAVNPEEPWNVVMPSYNDPDDITEVTEANLKIS